MLLLQPVKEEGRGQQAPGAPVTSMLSMWPWAQDTRALDETRQIKD